MARMRIAKALSLLRRRTTKGKGATPAPEPEKAGNGWPSCVGSSDVSTNNNDPIEILDSVCTGLGNNSFPLKITEWTDHDACRITARHTDSPTVESDSNGTTTEHESFSIHVTSADADGAGYRMDEIHMDTTICTKTIKIESLDATSHLVRVEMEQKTKTVHIDIKETVYDDAKTSVDCVLPDGVLTLDNSNIYPELLYLTKPMIGRWETTLDRSDPLDPLFKACGIGYVKRLVVDKIPLQIDLNYGEAKKFFQLTLHIPFGTRLMKWDLHGETYQDNDPDCGLWDGHVEIVKVDLNDCCPNTSNAYQIFTEAVSQLNKGQNPHVYAPTQIRTHKDVGVVHETRFTLPHKQLGTLLFLKYQMFPKKAGKEIVVMRCLRPVPAS